ncbi:ATP-binding protein [Virgibacillus soli]|uniref:ATP-binding protein n=1 Tax=Paracerasibacillus soli TaxID=480284 RepID=A0ABU5CPC3_9BACI|nr:ATP-binding protein [Virgibacillus soli]MDY0407697.1 ATP-binding protein [Virgibacillus soli]
MKRDILIVPFNPKEELIIACDNSGAIGKKVMDEVSVPYEIVGKLLFRVAYMECVAAGGIPFSIVLQNFNGDESWKPLVDGIQEGVSEAGIKELPITGSTESNFSLIQSATGMALLGKRQLGWSEPDFTQFTCNLAIIGKPLVGDEVVTQSKDVAPLQLFRWFAEQNDILSVVPVGSKGIAYEMSRIMPNRHDQLSFSSALDLKKSSGPSTCFIVVYKREFHEEVISMANKWIYGYTTI